MMFNGHRVESNLFRREKRARARKVFEDRFVAEQTKEIINLEHALANAEMKLSKKFLVMSAVDKFPKSWENFGMTLKHQKGILFLDDQMIAISIEEEHRNQTHKMSAEYQPRANLIIGKQKVNKAKPVVNMVVGDSSDASTSGATEGPLVEGHVGVLSKSAGVPDHKRKKLVPKIVDVAFLGYVETSYFLRFLIIKSKIPGIEVNTIVGFRDAVFLEDVFPLKTGIPSNVSLDDSLVSTSISEHVEKITNVGVNPSISTSLTH
ncbi:hypothetical protein Sango_1916800 [Sesamum angolense]|uniref:Uncharacterized protein n=1 Tax=Sesamum angolense TaxID=2727404 RepID=A0AAE1WDN3_9LAMI|nr:hypothetical protein Sango_1916800 [Sesamum angolense]